jgi:very-short-patch-repair endonuclease
VPGIRCHRSRLITDADRTVIDHIPVTSLAWTALDLAAVLTLQRLRSALEEIQRREILDFRLIYELLERSNGRKGTTNLKRALAQLTPTPAWTQSPPEREFLELIRAAGLPEPRANVLVDGILVDFFWPEHNLIVEIDPYGTHKARKTFEEDRHKDTVHMLAGRRSMRVTPSRLTQRAQLLAELGKVVA